MGVSGQITNGLSMTWSQTSNTAGTVQESVNLNGSPVAITDGNSDYQFQKQWSGSVALVGSTPQTLDLTALTGAMGTVSFSTIKYMVFVNTTTNASYKVTVGNAASNAFTGPLGGTTPTIDVYGGTLPTVIGRALGTGFTVDGTHKSLKLDPGANSQTINIYIAGT